MDFSESKGRAEGVSKSKRVGPCLLLTCTRRASNDVLFPCFKCLRPAPCHRVERTVVRTLLQDRRAGVLLLYHGGWPYVVEISHETRMDVGNAV